MGTATKHLIPDRVKPSSEFLTFGHSDAVTLSPERQSAGVSKFANGRLTRSGTGYFIAVPIRQQWASKGLFTMRQKNRCER